MERGRKHVQISFDELNRIRILDPEHFKQTEALADECTQFTDKIGAFSKTVGALTEILSTQSEKIEMEKLRAIGQRNRKDTEAETRKRRQQEMHVLLAQKQGELQRLHDQYESLVKVEQEQKLLMEKLSKP